MAIQIGNRNFRAHQLSYMLMRAPVLFAMLALLAIPASTSETSADEALVAERLALRALAALDGMLGAGHAQVLVEVRGERLQIRTETEIMTPLAQAGSVDVKEALRFLDLPGYYKERVATEPEKSALSAPPAQQFQKDFEHSLRDAGFEIKKIEATVLLDSALTEAAIREAGQLLPQLLYIDLTRGDKISIVRAPLRPAWKAAFSTPGDWRKLTFAGGALAGALLIVLILAMAFVRGARVFATELTARGFTGRLGNEIGEQSAPLPELLPGSPVGLALLGAGEESAAAPVAALGRRFDFLETADSAGTARILAEETPADLAQIFASLAKLAPESASRLFSKLPTEVQADASAAILKLKSLDPDRLSEIEERLKVLVANGLRGSSRLATILSRFPGNDRALLLERLADRDKPGVEDIQSQLFSFEDFEVLSPTDLRRIIGAVPYEVWGTALRGAPENLSNRVLSELPEGPRSLVREEAETPQAKDKVVLARSKILDTFLDLAAKGQVKLDLSASAEETL